jgi:hypothetical protein
MADDQTKVSGQDRKRINSSEISEVHDWATSLGVTPNALRKAMAAVGEEVDQVRAYLQKK